MRAVAIVSGGLDSVTLASLLRSEGFDLHLLSFDYGQRHQKELTYASRCSERLRAHHDVIDLRAYGNLLTGSALTDPSIDMPQGHYAEESMRITVVPNRNAIMLALAYGVAVAEGADRVAFGAHGGDHFIYPDCRPVFVEAFESMENVANDFNIPMYAPFLHRTKADIVALGTRLAVPFDETWSCYEGRELHCGRCGTCVERKHAFRDADVPDPTQYEDAAFGFDLTGPTQIVLAGEPKK
jgi:7-cyano-7-deazaguanine synthase